MLQPSLANKKSCGVHELIYYSLIKCDEKLRSGLLALKFNQCFGFGSALKKAARIRMDRSGLLPRA